MNPQLHVGVPVNRFGRKEMAISFFAVAVDRFAERFHRHPTRAVTAATVAKESFAIPVGKRPLNKSPCLDKSADQRYCFAYASGFVGRTAQ